MVSIGPLTCIGIVCDPNPGTTTQEAVEILMNDPNTDGVLMISEFGENMETNAARWVQENGTKPVVGFITGQTAPAGRTMGHAGAIVGGKSDTAAAKIEIMEECDIHFVLPPADIGSTMAELLR